MQQIDIKEYVKKQKEVLKDSAQAGNIKLGIIDATAADDTANAIYIKKKIEDCQEMGWAVEVYKTKNVPQAIKKANETCSTIIVQEPIAADAVGYSPIAIPPEKDVDGLNPISTFDPATPKGIIMYLNECGFEYRGKNAVVIGRSDIVGRPMAKMLLDKDMNVTVLHSKTKEEDKRRYLREADLVVIAVGKPGTVKREECPRAVVVDVGINRINGRLCGDFVENYEMTSETIWSTPVPGGVGLLTRLALLDNITKATIIQEFNSLTAIDSFEEYRANKHRIWLSGECLAEKF